MHYPDSLNHLSLFECTTKYGLAPVVSESLQLKAPVRWYRYASRRQGDASPNRSCNSVRFQQGHARSSCPLAKTRRTRGSSSNSSVVCSVGIRWFSFLSAVLVSRCLRMSDIIQRTVRDCHVASMRATCKSAVESALLNRVLHPELKDPTPSRAGSLEQEAHGDAAINNPCDRLCLYSCVGPCCWEQRTVDTGSDRDSQILTQFSLRGLERPFIA